ncbi:IMPACT family protein [Agrococcus casei]|uniref:Protein co-occurring with transport systems (COG1739) n=1 Tax=Agrococcus casei LMG 22410 TaxID=1255656 RepID=A0A1R4G611_9MICO|nr:YigZ family protein [Agrococcus casei]SJM63680.1 protein co-occurring with transport systems (COG1739) [Agrococcus casei LMG 22410]
MPDPAITDYASIARDASIENEIQRSRFIGVAVRVSSLEQFTEHVRLQRRAHPDARHVCTAAVVGAGGEASRSNDDGEPSGTAGAPMLQAILQQRLTDVGVIVVRYFGGTKLGAGGLIRAYAGAATDALAAAGRRHRVATRQLLLTLPIADAGRIEHALRVQGLEPEVTYGLDASLVVDVDADRLASVRDQLASLGVEHQFGERGFREVVSPRC